MVAGRRKALSLGIVTETNPETNFEFHKGAPSIFTDEVVLLNPLSGLHITANLGKDRELLWLEENYVCYRFGKGFYKARIENGDLVSRTLLITDPAFDFVHFAFSSSNPD